MRKCKSLLQNNYVFWGIALVLTVASQVAVFVFHWPIDPGTMPHYHLPPSVPVPRVQNLPPMTDDQLYHAIINANLSYPAVSSLIILFLTLCSINILLGARIINYPSWFSADVAGLQLAALYFGLPLKVYLAVWGHVLTWTHGWWQCVGYCLAFLTIYGLYKLIRSFIRLSIRIYRLMLRTYCMAKQAYLNLADNW